MTHRAQGRFSPDDNRVNIWLASKEVTDRMKKTIFAPYPMLGFAFLGMAIAFYDSYSIYNVNSVVSPPYRRMQHRRLQPVWKLLWRAVRVSWPRLLSAHVRSCGTARVRPVVARHASGRASLRCDGSAPLRYSLCMSTFSHPGFLRLLCDIRRFDAVASYLGSQALPSDGRGSGLTANEGQQLLV